MNKEKINLRKRALGLASLAVVTAFNAIASFNIFYDALRERAYSPRFRKVQIREVESSSGQLVPVKGVESVAVENTTYQKPRSYKTDDLRKDDELTLLARMIFGEARGCLDTDGVAVGYTAINRAKDGKKWNGETVKEAILKPWQYSCLNLNDPNREKVMNPEAYDPGAWADCLKISRLILTGKVKDPIRATHYHAKNAKPEWANDARMRRLGERKGHAFYRES